VRVIWAIIINGLILGSIMSGNRRVYRKDIRVSKTSGNKELLSFSEDNFFVTMKASNEVQGEDLDIPLIRDVVSSPDLAVNGTFYQDCILTNEPMPADSYLKTCFFGEALNENPLKKEDSDKYEKIKKYYHQLIATKFYDIMQSSLQKENPIDHISVSTKSNLTWDDQGNVFVDIVIYGIKLMQNAALRSSIPGTVTSRFILADEGFQLEWYEPSNSLLKKLCNNETFSINKDIVNSASKEECLGLKAAKLN